MCVLNKICSPSSARFSLLCVSLCVPACIPMTINPCCFVLCSCRYFSVGGNTDKTMLVLKMVDSLGTDLGMIDWFAVHPTSMNNTNVLISGDNKGYASLLMEKAMNPPGTLPGKGNFVAAFSQSNEGDVSPNINGAHCQDTGEMCDIGHSPCRGNVRERIPRDYAANYRNSLFSPISFSLYPTPFLFLSFSSSFLPSPTAMFPSTSFNL